VIVRCSLDVYKKFIRSLGKVHKKFGRSSYEVWKKFIRNLEEVHKKFGRSL
jgi:hypothetical protein